MRGLGTYAFKAVLGRFFLALTVGAFDNLLQQLRSWCKLFALLIENDPSMALRVVFLFVIIQFIENNILTPNIVGGNVRVNPFFIITGLVGASIVWGIPGMLLIVPFLAIVRIVLSHIESMKPYAFLLGDTGTSRHAITIDKVKTFFGKRKRRY